ncbi:apolipoprotein N-acyltransferase [Leucobacter massiliensis]|uniref:apolipoprotein N-acyltransferase n=1 Tax=Leucobacter massiliensis TaxID=1686285 RepID=UPI001FE412C8|nr:apolipoprotein N-acyltransferase [Leucobacter massiliensis]
MSSEPLEPPRLRWWLALACAAAGGYLLDIASPGLAWWWAAFPGVGLIVAAVWQQRWPLGLLLGAVAGAAFWMPHISWLTLYLGPVPWLALSTVMLLWFALFGAVASLATRGLAVLARGVFVPERHRRRALRALPLAQALAVAGLWVLREGVQGSWPYGGFPWGRLAHTQAEGPLLQSVSWLGFAGLSGVLALVCAVPVACSFACASAATGRATRPLLVATAASAVAILVLALLPATALERTGSVRIGAVQGNSKSGIFDDRDSGSVLGDHLAATQTMLDQLEAEDESVDLIVWPENSAEFGIPDNPLGSYRLAKLSERAGAPILIGSVLASDDGTYTNSSLLWGPEGQLPGRYDKLHPVPFAEYMPNREFFHALAPDLVDLVQLEYAPGTLPSALDLSTQAGVVRAGLAICFDIIFDAQAVAMVDGGAEVILAQTNNADFGRTDESAQQLAIARLRAVETGRALVNISTVGTSAVVAPDGSELDRLVPHTADAMVATVPLVHGATPALVIGAPVAGGFMLLGGAGLALGAAALIARARRSARSGSAAAGAEQL